jgi:hypothetical protein
MKKLLGSSQIGTRFLKNQREIDFPDARVVFPPLISRREQRDVQSAHRL